MELAEFLKVCFIWTIVLVVGSISIALIVKFGPKTWYKLRYRKYLKEETRDVIVLDVRIYSRYGAFLVVETDDYQRFQLEDYKLPGPIHVQGDVIPMRVVVNEQTGRVDYYNQKSLEYTYYPTE